MVKADPRSAPGGFVVEYDCCTLCGVPWHVAPDLFDYDDRGCWVKRQPQTPDEHLRMLEVLETQELMCIRYKGSDPEIRKTIPKGCLEPPDKG
jgi:ferredoxin